MAYSLLGILDWQTWSKGRGNYYLDQPACLNHIHVIEM
jgi:hypothetical protein